MTHLVKSLIVLSVITGRISIVLFSTVVGAPVGISSASFNPDFLVFTGIVKKKLLKTTQNKKKKHNKIFVIARNKLNSTESKISEELINNKISQEDFMTMINKERNIEN